MRNLSRSYSTAVTALATVALVCGSFAAAQSDAVPGVTSNEILLGGTHPFSGPVSAYGVIDKGIQAYFAYTNDHGGVNGRKITYKDLDDGYNPAQTVQLVKQLVEQDKVFALFNTLGTPPNLAIRAYCNDNKVPQLFVSTGATTWGADGAKYPYTIGFNADYQAEAIVFAKNILKNFPNSKIGIISQNDDFGQDYVTGLKAGLGSKASMIVKETTYEVTDPDLTSQISALKASGADLVLVAATPKFAVQSLVTIAKLGFKTQVYLTDVSASQFIMKAANKNGGDAATNGVVSASYVLDPTNPQMANLPAMKQYKDMLAKYQPSADPTDANVLYGVAAAYTMVDALQKTGKDLTRDKLMTTVTHMNEKNPFLYPGVDLVTSPSDRFPIREEVLIRYKDGLWVPEGSVIDARK